MTNHKDTDLREALRRKYADKPQLPAGFSERMMKRMEESQPRMEKAEATSNRRKWLYTAIGAVAACGLLLLALNYGGNDKETGNIEQVARNMQKITAPDTEEKQLRSDNSIAQNLPAHKDEMKRTETVTVSTTSRDKTLPTKENEDTHVTGDDTPSNNHQPSTVNHQPSTITYHPADYGLHYATNEINDSIYQAPSRMDEFIAKMANYNKVIGVPLNCATAKNDSTVSGTAYVFEDKEDFDVFGRLLQMACWYDSKSPGYMLNFSHQQFVFTLKDLHKEEKYFWLAERITGKRILLYCTHSPIEKDVSFACYQNFREQLTNVYFSSLQY